MKLKFFTAVWLILASSFVFAQLECEMVEGVDSIKVNIIGTFVGTSAIIERKHSVHGFISKDLFVEIVEDDEKVIFHNRQSKFNLTVLKTPSPDNFYKGHLKFGKIVSGLFCRAPDFI